MTDRRGVTKPLYLRTISEAMADSAFRKISMSANADARVQARVMAAGQLPNLSTPQRIRMVIQSLTIMVATKDAPNDQAIGERILSDVYDIVPAVSESTARAVETDPKIQANWDTFESLTRQHEAEILLARLPEDPDFYSPEYTLKRMYEQQIRVEIALRSERNLRSKER